MYQKHFFFLFFKALFSIYLHHFAKITQFALLHIRQKMVENKANTSIIKRVSNDTCMELQRQLVTLFLNQNISKDIRSQLVYCITEYFCILSQTSFIYFQSLSLLILIIFMLAIVYYFIITYLCS